MNEQTGIKTPFHHCGLCLIAGFLAMLSGLPDHAAAQSGAGTTAGSDTAFRQVVISEFGGPDVLEMVQRIALPQPGPGEARIRVLAAGVSYTDTMIRRGVYPGIEDELPYAPGYDLVGIVDAVGDGATDVTVGQRVADLSVWGAYSDYVVRPADGLVPVPPGVDSADAVSLVLSYMTAYQMMYRVAEVKAGQTILIHGASGGVGTALAQLGQIAGLRMLGTASTRNQDYVSALGVTPIDYRTEDFVERAMEETDGAGVDAVFDAISLDNFKRSFQTLKPGGVLVPYGFYGSSDAASDFAQWMSLRTEWNAVPDGPRAEPFYSISGLQVSQRDWFKEDLAALLDLLASGTLKPKVSRTFPLEEVVAAHQLFEDRQVRGKIVMRLHEDPMP